MVELEHLGTQDPIAVTADRPLMLPRGPSKDAQPPLDERVSKRSRTLTRYPYLTFTYYCYYYYYYYYYSPESDRSLMEASQPAAPSEKYIPHADLKPSSPIDALLFPRHLISQRASVRATA